MIELGVFNTLFDGIKYDKSINDDKKFTQIYNDYNNKINELKRNNNNNTEYLELIRANIIKNYMKIVEKTKYKVISIYNFINGDLDGTKYTFYRAVSDSLITPEHYKEPLLTIKYEYNNDEPREFKISDDNDKVSFISILLADQYRSLTECIEALPKVGGKNKKRRTQKKRKNKKKV